MFNLNINPEQKVKEITFFIQETLKKSGFKKLVIGLSGGIDSSTSYILAVRAVGVENVIGVMLPYGDLQKEAIENVYKLTQSVKAPGKNILKIPIDRFMIPFKEMIDIDELRLGNVIARIRMIILFDMAKKHKALVCGTENKTEHLLGYFTRFGDEASDIEPVRKLYKTQIRQLADYLKVPREIIEMTPTAGLWPGQTDEGEFGFSYKDADQILYLYNDLGKPIEEMTRQGFKIETVNRVLIRMEENDFKHKLPYTLDK